jgi:hypothetical protein
MRLSRLKRRLHGSRLAVAGEGIAAGAAPAIAGEASVGAPEGAMLLLPPPARHRGCRRSHIVRRGL